MPGRPTGAHQDPTVCAPAEKAGIEAYIGVSLKDADQEAIRFVVDRSKQAGNDAFRQKNYKEAVKLYSQAIAGDEADHTLYGNRSAAYLALGLYEQAEWDARKAVMLRGDWPKGYYRLGCAHMALGQWREAVAAFKGGLHIAPGFNDVSAKLAEAQAKVDREDAARRAAAATARRSLVLKLRAARREDQKLAMLNQFKQSMTAPDWDLEDLEWRPTWLPSMRHQPLDVIKFTADPKRRLLLSFLNSLADLAHPKNALRTLTDAPRLEAFRTGIQAALATLPGARVLTLGSGGGVLQLMAAAAGAGHVTAVERSRMLYRMAKQVLEANVEAPGASVVHLLDCGLRGVGVQGEAAPPEVAEALRRNKHQAMLTPQAASSRAIAAAQQAGGAEMALPNKEDATAEIQATSPAADAEEEATQGGQLPCRADILVSDLLDHSILGLGLLPALDYAAQRLLKPGGLVVPQVVHVHAQLLELRLGPVCGFDLSAMDSYRWFPGPERLQLDRVPHRELSEPFSVHSIDLQARAASAQEAWEKSKDEDAGRECGEEGDGRSASPAQEPKHPVEWEFQAELDIPVTCSGHWNAVAFWFDLGMGGKVASTPVLTSYCSGSSSSSSSSSLADDVSSMGAVLASSSCGQAVQYIDGMRLTGGTTVRLRVQQDRGQILFTSFPPQCRPHHALVPRWHYDMIQDTMRNDAYDAAIRAAVAGRRDAGCAHLVVLDIGAGSSLLSMMAARAGADAVYGAEVSGHMCDVAEECSIANGFLGKITMLDRDARRLDVVRKPDGTPPDLPRQADLAVFEVFDSGLIGEGVLHALAAARTKLLRPDAVLVPAAAVVWCQPLQMRVGTAAGVDVQQANRWRWRPDYEGVELAGCREEWIPLAEPTRVFAFDFYETSANMQPAETQLQVQFTREGVFNAVAMWFDLHLDEATSLSTSPYADKGPTWQQAVQWVREVKVGGPGETLVLTARHDTYSIAYEVEAGRNGGEEALEQRCTGVPLQDPVWRAAYDSLQGLNSELVRSCVQNPLEYRAVAQTAVQMAARPHDLGVDSQQAAEFCMKMMG